VAAQTRLSPVVVRPPLVYGAGVKRNFLRLVPAVDRGMPLPLGGIVNARSLVYVENLVDVLLQCLLEPAAAGRTFLVSDGPAVSTPELVRNIARALGRPARLLPAPVEVLRLLARMAGRAETVDRLCESLVVDHSTLSAELGWSPPCIMKEGLGETVR
jgi:nucleoside-diphosphate-sugar epimerase